MSQGQRDCLRAEVLADKEATERALNQARAQDEIAVQLETLSQEIDPLLQDLTAADDSGRYQLTLPDELLETVIRIYLERAEAELEKRRFNRHARDLAAVCRSILGKPG